MHALTQWQQTATFDPYNPNQIVREPNNVWPGQGGHASFYWNRQPTTVGQVLGGAGLAAIPPLVQAIGVAVIAAAAGYFAVTKLGPKLGLSGHRRRRR